MNMCYVQTFVDNFAFQIIAQTLSEEEIAGLKEMFKMMDTDNSGAITFDELKAGLEKLGSGLMDSEVQTIMQAVSMCRREKKMTFHVHLKCTSIKTNLSYALIYNLIDPFREERMRIAHHYKLGFYANIVHG